MSVRSLPDLLAMCGELVALPSVSSTDPASDMGNRRVIERLAEWLETLAFRVRIEAVDGAADKWNLIATRGEGEGGLVLAGHSDTVPCDEALWRSNPFALTERDGALHGLGIADMKCFFAFVLEALAAIADRPWWAPVTVLATADEESTMRGARALLARGERLGTRALIGEPTGLAPVRMHKGVSSIAVRVEGSAGHASNPDLGHNAIEGMHRVVTALLGWRDALADRFQDRAFTISRPTLNLGHVHGGDSANRICGDCELHVDLRLLPGMDADAIHEELAVLARAALAESGCRVDTRRLSLPVPPFATAADAGFVRELEALSGARAGSVAFGTEAPFLAGLGLETVIFGAGDIDVAHRPDEHLPLARIAPMRGILRTLLERHCLQ